MIGYHPMEREQALEILNQKIELANQIGGAVSSCLQSIGVRVAPAEELGSVLYRWLAMESEIQRKQILDGSPDPDNPMAFYPKPTVNDLVALTKQRDDVAAQLDAYQKSIDQLEGNPATAPMAGPFKAIVISIQQQLDSINDRIGTVQKLLEQETHD